MTNAGSADVGRTGQGVFGAGDDLAQVKVLVLGECLVDLAPASLAAPVAANTPPGAKDFVAMPGGGPANVAVGLARLQVPCAFAGRFARGGFGPWLHQNLVDNGLDLSFSVPADEAATIALVTLDSHGRATYTFYGETTADWQWAASELPDLASPGLNSPAIGAVHTGSLALALAPGAGVIASWLTDLRQEGRVVISFDPNVRPAFVGDISRYRDHVTQVVRSSHIVKASTEDVEVMYPGTAPRAVAEGWLALGVPLVVITEGSDGATAYHQNGGSSHCSPPPVEVADTIGAGDAFTSALLAYLSEHGLLSPGAITKMTEAQLGSSITRAVAASALTCTRLGADPPSRLELARFIDEHS
jgi:fructokinase